MHFTLITQLVKYASVAHSTVVGRSQKIDQTYLLVASLSIKYLVPVRTFDIGTMFSPPLCILYQTFP